MGPIVASISAFISTTSLPCLNASKTTWAPNSTEPVTSTNTSTSGERANRRPSSVATGLLARIASSSCRCVSATATACSRRLSVGDCDDAHPGRAVYDHICEALAHEAGANDRDPNGLSLLGSRLESSVDQNHGFVLSIGSAREQPR